MRIKAGAVVITYLVALAGWANAQQGCPCAKYESAVTVTVSEAPGYASVAVDKPRVCLTRQGEVTFHSTEGDFEISFDKGDGTPFASGKLNGKKDQKLAIKANRSNKVKCGRMFRYSVTLKKAGKELKIDPEIVIEAGVDQ